VSRGLCFCGTGARCGGCWQGDVSVAVVSGACMWGSQITATSSPV
jgi:hypothetical protein